MNIAKTTVYTLTKNDIQDVCYSLFVRRLKEIGVKAYFEAKDVLLIGGEDSNGYLGFLSAELRLEENEEI